jgi:hypothetical protein
MKKHFIILTLISFHKLALAQDKPSNFKEQLNLGEILNLSPEESTKKETTRQSNNPESIEKFLKSGLAYLAEKNKNKKTFQFKSETGPLTYLPKELSTEEKNRSFLDFQKCALNSLPIVKHLLGKTLLSSSPAEIDDDYNSLSEISKNLFSSLKNGQLICGPFLGKKIFLVFLEGEAKQFLSEQAIFLSIVTRINDPHSFSTAWIITAFTQGFNKDATNNDFWKSYWKYLSLEILIKNNFYFMSPDEFSLKILNKEWDKAKKQQLEETHTALKEI